MSLFSGGGGGPLFREGGSKFFSFLSGGGSQFFSSFFKGRVIIFLKFFFIEKINYEYPAAAGAGFRFLLILSLPSKKNAQKAETKRCI